MNTPNYYQSIVLEACKACNKDLLDLFHEKGLTELEVTEKACHDTNTDRCYCTVWDQYSNNIVEAIVEKVFVKENHLAVNYVIEGVEYYGDLYDIKQTDLLSIYETCHAMLIK